MTMMKRFIVFAGDYYYPSGGWHDYILDADTLEETKLKISEYFEEHIYGFDWLHIIDLETKEEIELDDDEERKLLRRLQEKRDKRAEAFLASSYKPPTPHEHLQSLRNDVIARKQRREENRKNKIKS